MGEQQVVLGNAPLMQELAVDIDKLRERAEALRRDGHTVVFLAVELMRGGMHPQKACQAVLERMLKKNPEHYKKVDANVFAINRKGEIGAMGMQLGRFQYAVWTKTSSELKAAGSMV